MAFCHFPKLGASHCVFKADAGCGLVHRPVGAVADPADPKVNGPSSAFL